MNNDDFQTIIKENKYEQLFNPNQNYSCQYYDENEFIIKNRNGDSFLNVFSLNIRSLPKNGGELLNFLGNLKTEFRIIILTEIGSRNLTVVEKLFPNYTFFHKIPHKNNWGGVGIYVHNSLSNVGLLDEINIALECDCTKCEVESLFVEFMFNGAMYTVGGIYRHPNGNVSHFVTALECVLHKINETRTTVLAGDMNIDIIKFSNEDVMSYMSTLMSFKYLPYITVPSRITQLSTTCIDHIFMKTSHKDKVLNIMSGLFYCEITDHLPCFLSLKFEKYNRMDERPMIRIFGEKNCAIFVQKMQSYNWNEIHNDTGEEIYDKFISVVHNIYQQAFPLVRVSRKRWRDKPWLTKALKVSIKHKNKLYREYILHPDNLHQTKYNAYKNCLRKCLLEAEKVYYNELFENNKDSVFNLWKTLNPIINPKKQTTRTVINKLVYEGKRITNKQDISDTMNKHFCDIGVRLQSELQDCGNRYLEYLPPRISDSFYLAPTCKNDVLLEIKKMKPMKAPGHDSIGTKIIQLCPEIFAENLSRIYNNAMIQGVYPNAMKIAKVIALFKSGIKANPNNYRPISLLSHFDKIFEKILCKRLVAFLEYKQILYCHQYGFRKLYSTAMALIEITDNIKRILDEKNYVIGIFIDFKKAFDTVDHEIMLSKLECYGIRGHANLFFRSYLTNRRQFTVANGVQSDIGIVKCGVPQGSVLGPLFFLLYINDIYRAVGCNAARLFADDTSLLSSGRNLHDAINQAKEFFHKLYDWCLANKLSINSDKTNFVLFHMKNKPVPKNFGNIQTEHMTIRRVKTVNYLGLVIDENLYWNAHVDYVCASLVKYFGIFNHIKSFITSRIARQLYFAFINSRINYGIEVYGHCANEYLSKLQILQNKLLKLLLKLDRRTSTNQLHRDLSLLKVSDIHDVNMLCFVNNCRATRCPETFCNYYQVRRTERELRNNDHLDVPRARTEMGLSSCNIKGAKLWNKHFTTVNSYLYKKCFKAKVTKYFIEKYEWYLNKGKLNGRFACPWVQ